MPVQQKEKSKGNREARSFFLFAVICTIFSAACSEIEKPQTQPFYAESKPPAQQEFHWSNGKTPKSLDPARAAAAPETDIVRALYEGLTDIDPRTLKEIPAVAEKWTSSDDQRIWTFQLRRNARWSNGKSVTADDFVTSWKRFARIGDKTAHRELFQNIVGLRMPKNAPVGEPTDFFETPIVNSETVQHSVQPKTTPILRSQEPTVPPPPANAASNPRTENKVGAAKSATAVFGAEAVDETTLRVTLEMADRDFPKLVANPIFRPVYGEGLEFETDQIDRDIVTNGPFKLAGIGNDGITLDRSETYWRRSAVDLEHVHFVPQDNAEAALDAYKKGEIDAVTNVEFAPLALKLLAPYDDFRQATHSALNFYEFNTKNPPFDDRRVREALAISIDRERLTSGELEGSARPALSFLPLGDKKNARLLLNVGRAKQLVEDAGYRNGAGFPRIRLLINRNDTQQRVARAVAKMWKQNLNLDTDIIVKDLSEIEVARGSGEFDLVRRGVVIPTTDEIASMSAIFGVAEKTEPQAVLKESEKSDAQPTRPNFKKIEGAADEHRGLNADKNVIVTEEEAVFELNAIPLYFPLSYALVKPYVRGFEINGLDAVSLSDIHIDSNWQAGKAIGE